MSPTTISQTLRSHADRCPAGKGRAIRFHRYGGPEVLQLEDVTTPQPGPGQLLVAVRAAGINPADLKLRSGAYHDVKPIEFPYTPGTDVAGTVAAIGSPPEAGRGTDGTAGITLGDEVLGFALTGGYAQYALLAVAAIKPAHLGWAEAAAIPVAAETATRALHIVQVDRGDVVLVHGAGGSVGSMAVQLARALGATVIGTADPRQHDHLRALGAHPVAYGPGWADRVRALSAEVGLAGVDAVFDTAGHGVLPDSISLAGGTRRVTTTADHDSERYGIHRTGGDERDDPIAALDNALHLHGLGRLTVSVAATQPLAQAATAHQRLEDGTTRGKIVLISETGRGRWRRCP